MHPVFLILGSWIRSTATRANNTSGEVLTGERRTLDSVEILDLAMERWTPGPALPVPLHGVPRLDEMGGSVRAGAIENAGRVMSWTPPSP